MNFCNDQQHHPQVPKTGVSILLAYCHQCQCWVRYAHVYTDTGETDPLAYDTMDIRYGPFDGVRIVLDDVIEYLSGVLYDPGRPWDQGGWLRGADRRSQLDQADG